MNKKIRIVLIEDDMDDVELLHEALESRNVPFLMKVIKDGSAAITFCEEHTDFFPDIIVMDFNLPRVHGKDVIAKIRCNEKFAHVPILVLSTSSAIEDMAYANKAGADKYLVKPATIEAIQETVETIVSMVHSKSISAM
jgi:DNA-binding response OmpR family regulator